MIDTCRVLKFSYIFQHGETGNFTDQRYTLNDVEASCTSPSSLKSAVPNGWSLVARRQFTGLLDKNGKEIYEGDILRDDDGLAVCSWCNNMSGWGYCLVECDGSYNGAEGTMAEWAQESEVIGNIYEHPGLLEVPS